MHYSWEMYSHLMILTYYMNEHQSKGINYLHTNDWYNIIMNRVERGLSWSDLKYMYSVSRGHKHFNKKQIAVNYFTTRNRL